MIKATIKTVLSLSLSWQDAGHMQEFVNKGKKLLEKLFGDE